MTDQSDDVPSETLPASIASFEDFQDIDNIPFDPVERLRLEVALSQQFVLRLRERLKPADLDEWDRVKSISELGMSLRDTSIISKLPAASFLRINVALDELILEQARTIGAKVFLCSNALRRILQWEREPYGPRLYERLGQELALRVRVGHGEAKLPLSPGLRPLRKELLGEIKMLRGVLIGKFPQRRRPNPAELLRVAMQILEDKNEPYEQLRWNLAAFRLFIESQPSSLEHLVFRGNITPVIFVDAFIAHCTNRSPEATRQAIARMKAKR